MSFFYDERNIYWNDISIQTDLILRQANMVETGVKWVVRPFKYILQIAYRVLMFLTFLFDLIYLQII